MPNGNLHLCQAQEHNQISYPHLRSLCTRNLNPSPKEGSQNS